MFLSPFPEAILTIGLFTLSGRFDTTQTQAGAELFKQWGVTAIQPSRQSGPVRFLAASDDERLRQFHEVLANPKVDMMMAYRGGYGSTRIIDRIDWDLMRRRNIPICGYSDVCGLHLSALRHGCLRNIHGPMFCSTLGQNLKEEKQKQAMQKTLASFAACLRKEPNLLPNWANATVIQPGQAAGQLIPTNLSLLTAMIGTGQLPDFHGAILVLEDVSEASHRIDRMLQQLRATGLLSQLGGLVFGQFSEGEDSQYLPEILKDFAADVKGPVICDVPFGHIFPSISLPVGAEVVLSADAKGACTLSRSVLDAYEPAFFIQEGRPALPYRLLRPSRLAAGQKAPLILFLHGAGERGMDNRRQLVHVAPNLASPECRSTFPCFVAIPQCPEDSRWVEVDWGLKRHTMPQTPSAPLAATMALVDALIRTYPIDPDRIYVMGLSMGGYGTWDLIQRYPKRFAAAVPICGGGDEAMAKACAQVPVWAFHGAVDTVVPTLRSRNMVEALQKAGGNPHYTEFAETGHDAWTPAIRLPGLLPWLFSQRRSTAN